MDEKKKQMREILPDHGIWTVEDLARYLDLPPHIVQQKLSELGVEVLTFSKLYKHRLLRLEDLKNGENG